MAGEVKADALFVGLTRPPMLFGASYLFVLANGFIAMISFIMTNDFRFLAMMFPVHAVGYYICSKEPLFMELYSVKMQKCNKCSNRFYHGANSYDPS